MILSYTANLYTRIVTSVAAEGRHRRVQVFPARRALQQVDLSAVTSDGYGFQIEMNFKVWRKGMRVREIPILFVDRRVGVSKMNKKIIWEAMWLVWRLRIN